MIIGRRHKVFKICKRIIVVPFVVYLVVGMQMVRRPLPQLDGNFNSVDPNIREKPDRIDFYFTYSNIEKRMSTSKAFSRKPGVSSAQSNMKSHETRVSTDEPIYIFNCSNVEQIKFQKRLYFGSSKQVLLGSHNDQRVLVEVANKNVTNVMECIQKKKYVKPSDCFVFSNLKLMNGIRLFKQLKHRGLIKLLGYCIRGETEDVSKHGIVLVHEFGIPFSFSIKQSLFTRLQYALDFLELLDYFEHSEIGSLMIQDFKPKHFVTVGNSVKMMNLEDIDHREPSCEETQNCEFGLVCDKGICKGHNAKHNLRMLNRLYLRGLFSTEYDKTSDVVLSLSKLSDKLNRLDITAHELCVSLRILLDQLLAEIRYLYPLNTTIKI